MSVSTIDEAPLALPTVSHRSPWRTAVRRFVRHRVAVASAVYLVLVVLAAIFARQIARHDPNAVDLLAANAAPSHAHLLGTDTTGRDVFARLLFGARVSLGVGIVAALIAVVLGTVLGSIAGLLGGAVDGTIMRLADVFMSFPTLVVMVVIAGVFGPNIITMVIAIGLFEWPSIGRLVRGVTLSLREHDYVLASRSVGAGPGWLLLRHVIPAALPPVSVAATLAVSQAIMLEATLSFLGLGVQPPTSSWGNMLIDAQNITIINSAPWLWLAPGLAVVFTVLAVNFIGDGLRDAVDPRRA